MKRRHARSRALAACLLFAGLPLCAQTLDTSAKAPEADKPAAAVSQPESGDEVDDLMAAGKALFEEYAPEELKQTHEFPDRAQWEAFVQRLQKALKGESLDDLIALEPETREALRVMEELSVGTEFTDWVRGRLSLIEGAKVLRQQSSAVRPPQRPQRPRPPGGTTPRPPETKPESEPVPVRHAEIPAYDYWFKRIQAQNTPAGAKELIPLLTRTFGAERIPGELAWLAEVESMFKPGARSPVGALGLYQLMPDTAKSLGLSIWAPDERRHPEKSARAAATYLRRLHGLFRDWPLAIAAYNAGEGTVRRLLAKRGGAKSFADIAPHLPVETRLYVPKVLATVEARTGVGPDKLPAPRP